MECNSIVYCVYFWIVHTVNGHIMANQSEAEAHCKKNGGLASNEYFKRSNGQLLLDNAHIEMLDIRDGESAWITGYVNFSTFVSWTGCYSEKRDKNGIKKNYLEKNSIYSCSNYCIDSKQECAYIGIHANMCICLTYSELYKLHNWQPSPNEQCGLKQYAPSDLTSGGNAKHEAINVYQIHEQSTLFWSPAIPNLQQCVYASNSRDIPKYATASCFMGSENGFICSSSVYETLNKTCELYHTVDSTCFVSESSTWVDARNICYDYTGKLVSHIYVGIRQHAIINMKYWTGIYRSFNIMDNFSPNYACLAVTRFQNKLVLDADNCAVEKQIVCKDNMSNIQVTIKTTYAVTEDNSEYTYMEAKFIYIGIGVGVVVITAIVIMCVFVRRNLMHSEHTSEVKHATKTTLTIDTRAIASASVDRKPETSQTNHKQNVPLEQNYAPVNYTTHEYLPSSSNESVYDRTNLKKTEHLANLNNMDHNVYNHITFGETDTYDKLVGNKSEKLVKLNDNTYSNMGDV